MAIEFPVLQEPGTDIAHTETDASGPAMLIGAPALRASLALLCCYLPARKSTRIGHTADGLAAVVEEEQGRGCAGLWQAPQYSERL